MVDDISDTMSSDMTDEAQRLARHACLGLTHLTTARVKVAILDGMRWAARRANSAAVEILTKERDEARAAPSDAVAAELRAEILRLQKVLRAIGGLTREVDTRDAARTALDPKET